MSDHGNIKFWQEIGRRNVLRVAAVYVGFSWAVVHSGVVVGEALELPHWIMRFVSAVLIVGFPAVVAFAWVYEITPEGLKRSTEVEKDASLTHRTAQRLNVVIIALIVILAGLYGADRFLLPHEAAEGGAHIAAEGAPNVPAGEGISIAVLPFLNLSGDPGQEFFSDGMTEEITSALAKVPGLQVVGRTSAFEFKGQNKDLHAIGLALRVGHLLEGSVRKVGSRVRITAQLIRADNGTHIWTENYDRELTDIFVTQDDIAKAIAGALRVPLGLKQGGTLVVSRTVDTDSYQQYLRAKALLRNRGGFVTLAEPIDLLEQVVAREPGYAPAWALLALTYRLAPGFDSALFDGPLVEERRVTQAFNLKGEAAARRAVALDPHSSDAYTALAANQPLSDWLASEDLYKRALELDPLNPDALGGYCSKLGAAGRLKEALAVCEQLRYLDPTARPGETVTVLFASGQTEAALRLSEAGGIRPAYIYAALGRYGDAADSISAQARRCCGGDAEAAARLLRTAPAASAQGDLPYLGRMSFAYLYVGLPARAIDELERSTEGYGAPYPFIVSFAPSFAPARKTERFKALVRKAGLVDYWRARGWPDVCHPVGTDDFVCE